MRVILGILLAVGYAHGSIEVHGHRGARAVLPENTLAGFRYALDVGVDVLELDLAVTKDKVVIISHDPTFNEVICTYEGEVLPFVKMTLGQVKSMDCGSKKNPRFPRQEPVPGAKIPTLDELFTMVKKRRSKVLFNIEMKIVPGKPELTPAPHEFAQLLYDVLKRHGMVKRVLSNLLTSARLLP